jgi:sugar/nucleoside kinase (ribokinase family)
LGREILARDFQLVLGSASAIFACGAARLGHRVTFVSRVGDDYFGRFCLAELRAKGVSTRRVKRDAATRTGVTVALSTAQDRALVTFLGAIAELSEKDIPANIWRGRKHLHLTSYFLQDGLRPAFPRLMAEARRNGLTVSFDPNSAPGQTWPGEIWQAIGQTEILLCNEDEARQLTGARTAQAAGRKLREHSPCVVVKCGKRGAWGWRRGMETHSPAFPAQILDTTGAGDSFAAGFVHGFLSGKNLPDCLTLGNACGALSAQGAGGTAGQPGQETLKKFLAHHGRTHS